MRYTEHPTATRNYLSTEEDISLPALTICDNHFRYGEMAEELDFPKVPFGPGITPNKIKIDPPYR